MYNFSLYAIAFEALSDRITRGRDCKLSLRRAINRSRPVRDRRLRLIYFHDVWTSSCVKVTKVAEVASYLCTLTCFYLFKPARNFPAYHYEVESERRCDSSHLHSYFVKP